MGYDLTCITLPSDNVLGCPLTPHTGFLYSRTESVFPYLIMFPFLSKVVYYCAHEKALENQPCCRQVAKTSALSSTPNTFIAIERAFIKAYHFTQSDHEKTIKDVKKYIDIDEDFIDTEVYGGYSVSSPDPDKKGTLTLKDTIVDLGYTEDYDIESHYNTDIYKKALDSILAEGSDDIYKSLEDHFNEFE